MTVPQQHALFELNKSRNNVWSVFWPVWDLIYLRPIQVIDWFYLESGFRSNRFEETLFPNFSLEPMVDDGRRWPTMANSKATKTMPIQHHHTFSIPHTRISMIIYGKQKVKINTLSPMHCVRLWMYVSMCACVGVHWIRMEWT